MAMTNAMEDRVLNTMRGTALAAWTPFVGLASAAADPEVPTVTEVTGANGLTRQSATLAAPANEAGAQVVRNSAILNFGTYSGGSQVTITHVIVADAASAGETRYVFPLAASKVVNPGDPVSFQASQLGIGQG